MNRYSSSARLGVEKPVYVLTLFVLIAIIWAYNTPIDITVTAPGVVRPQGDVIRIIAEAGGRIGSVYLQEGAIVRRGDILVQLDAREVEIRKHSLELKIHSTEQRLGDLQRRIDDAAAIEDQTAMADVIDTDATTRLVLSNLEHARLRWARAEELFAAGLISRQALDEAKTAFSQAQAEHHRLAARSTDLKSAQTKARLRDLASDAVPLRAELATLYNQLEQSQIEHDRLTILSPCDGQLTSVTTFHAGEVLSPGVAVAAIVPQHHPLVVEAWLPTGARRFVAVGQRVRLQTDSFPPDEYDRIDGTVHFISPDATFSETQLGAYRIVVTPASQSVPLSLGMSFKVYFVTREEPLLWLFFQKIRKLGD